MNYQIMDYITFLRQKTKVWLIDNDYNHFKNHSLPFDNNNVPIMCDFLNEDNFKSFDAYESGNRSILFQHDGKWIKAKGIGIPEGITRPIYDKGRIYTYRLNNDPGMCHKHILWGFMQRDEYNCELYGSSLAEKIGQKIELIGMTSFDDVKYINLKDRVELFSFLSKIKRDSLLDIFRKDGIKTSAYSTYFYVPSDIRVGELFFTFMFPNITDFIDPDSIKDYVEWLGSSCGYLLRQFHNSGTLHGTWVGPDYTSIGLLDIHSNSYTGNYLVDYDELTMCDFDLSKPLENESEKEIEKWALVHVENPLYYAGSYRPKDALNQGMARKNPFREELAKIFEQAVDVGYSEGPINIEKKLKRETLDLIIKAKKFMWKLYELPENLIGQIEYVDYVIFNKKIKPNDFKKARSNFWN